MEIGFNTTGNNDENRVCWLCTCTCVKSQTVYYNIIKRRDMSIASTTVLLLRGLEMSPGDCTSSDPVIQDSTVNVPSFDYFHLNTYKCLLYIVFFLKI